MSEKWRGLAEMIAMLTSPVAGAVSTVLELSVIQAKYRQTGDYAEYIQALETREAILTRMKAIVDEGIAEGLSPDQVLLSILSEHEGDIVDLAETEGQIARELGESTSSLFPGPSGVLDLSTQLHSLGIEWISANSAGNMDKVLEIQQRLNQIKQQLRNTDLGAQSVELDQAMRQLETYQTNAETSFQRSSQSTMQMQIFMMVQITIIWAVILLGLRLMFKRRQSKTQIQEVATKQGVTFHVRDEDFQPDATNEGLEERERRIGLDETEDTSLVTGRDDSLGGTIRQQET